MGFCEHVLLITVLPSRLVRNPTGRFDLIGTLRIWGSSVRTGAKPLRVLT